MEYRNNVFYSPEGNAEIWDQKPEGYLTEQEWFEQNPPALPEEPTLDEMKQFKLMNFADRRYMDEIAGTTFNSVTVKTDRESQAMITGAALQAINTPDYTCKWKASDGTFVELNAQAIIAIAQAVRTHVQNCFNKEAEKAALVMAAQDMDTLNAINWDD